MMVGREVELNIRAEESNIGEPYFFVKNCNLKKDGRDVLTDINFEIRKGEVLGIAGVDGNGQTELIEILTGLRTSNSAKIVKDGIEIKGQSSDFLRAKIGHIPEDRLDRGLISQMTIEENFILGYHNLSEYVKHGFLNFKNSKENTLKAIKEYKIKTPNERVLVGSLSGGNQQKVVVARVVSQNPDVLIVAQPTRGVDVGAMEYIHRQILKLKKEGKAILLISADLEEVYDLSDRIAVIYNGKINYILDKNQTNQLELGLLMTGGTLND